MLLRPVTALLFLYLLPQGNGADGSLLDSLAVDDGLDALANSVVGSDSTIGDIPTLADAPAADDDSPAAIVAASPYCTSFVMRTVTVSQYSGTVTKVGTNTATASATSSSCAPSSMCAAPTQTGALQPVSNSGVTTGTTTVRTGTATTEVAFCTAISHNKRARNLKAKAAKRGQDILAEKTPDCPTQGEQMCGGGCVDVTNEIEHCGACYNSCIIRHAEGVGCDRGQCVALSCSNGYRPNTLRTACVPKSAKKSRKRA